MNRDGQTPQCITAEVARLTKERDEAIAEVARLKAGGCARDQRTTQWCAEAVELQERLKRLEVALEGTVNWIVQLAESGDAGFWDAEEMPQIITARAALKAKEAKP
jgi:hypothetical protein